MPTRSFPRIAAAIAILLVVSVARADDAARRASLRAWFVQALTGAPAPFPTDRMLSAAEVDEMRARLWEDYRAAAIELEWDRGIAEAPVVAGPEAPTLETASIAAGGETMPYRLFARGERPERGYPLFIQMHGGGNIDAPLEHPHAWEVNSRDWNAQIGVCMRALPEGMYFVPRMANDNRGRWWFRHNHLAFDAIIRRAILFRGVDPDRIYMMGISEGAYGTEALAPFWADRLAGGCAMAGGAGGGERLRSLRNTAFRNDTGEKDTMFDRIGLAKSAHAYLALLKESDPQGYDHMLLIQEGRGHGIDYRPGPAWIAERRRDPRPTRVVWFSHALDDARRDEFAWISLVGVPQRDILVVAEIDRAANAIAVEVRVTPESLPEDSPLRDGSKPPPIDARPHLEEGSIVLHLDDALVDLDRPVSVRLNGRDAVSATAERRLAHLAEDIARHGDPGRVFPARLVLPLAAER